MVHRQPGDHVPLEILMQTHRQGVVPGHLGQDRQRELRGRGPVITPSEAGWAVLEQLQPQRQVPPSPSAGSANGHAEAGDGVSVAMEDQIHHAASLLAAPRISTFLTLMACQRPPRAVATPRAFSASARSANVVTPVAWICRITGSTLAANWSAAVRTDAPPLACASARLMRLPRASPRAFFACSTALVRAEMIARSRSANAA